MKDASRMKMVSWAEVRDKIQEKASNLDSLLATIQASRPRNNRNLALFRLGYCALRHLKRAADSVEGDIEQLAWRVRNLHEIDLILRFVSRGDDDLAQWLGQMPNDEKDLVEGFLCLEDSYRISDVKEMKARLERLNAVCERMGTRMSRAFNMRTIAKALEKEKEYRLIYKLYSKFVHPSSWIVNGAQERTGATTYRNILVSMAQVLGDRIRSILRKELRMEDRDMVRGVPCTFWEIPEI